MNGRHYPIRDDEINGKQLNLAPLAPMAAQPGIHQGRSPNCTEGTHGNQGSVRSGVN